MRFKLLLHRLSLANSHRAAPLTLLHDGLGSAVTRLPLDSKDMMDETCAYGDRCAFGIVFERGHLN